MRLHQSRPKKIEVKSGYVAFFDILGYREMTSRADFEKVVGALEEAIKDAEALLDRKQMDNCELFSFGDSMILFCAGNSEDETLTTALMQLPIFARVLFSRMFKRGMPIRGAIAKGEFYFKDNCYAGKPLNEAYEFANSLEFSGVVLTPSAEDLIADGPEFEGSDPNYKDIAVPIKGYGRQKMFVLKQRIKPDRAKIRDAFERHGKSIAPAVLPKLNNTLEVLQLVYEPSEGR